MGKGDPATPAKAPKAPAAAQELPSPLATSPSPVPSTGIYPDWPGYQAYSPYAPGHPYMWGPQPLMAPYGTPPPPYVMYPPGVYPHPSMPPGSHPFSPYAMPSPNENVDVSGAVQAGVEADGKSSVGNKGGPITKSSEGKRGRPVTKSGEGKKGGPVTRSKSLGLNMIKRKSNKNGSKKSGTLANAASQSDESGSGDSGDSDADSQNDSEEKAHGGPDSSDEAAQNGSIPRGAQNGLAIMPTPAAFTSGVTGPTTNLNIGMDYWGTPIPSTNPPIPANAVTGAAVPGIITGSREKKPSELWDEREQKRQKRKQSNRESARRSRLRKQAECEELAQRLDSLKEENTSLRTELERMKKEHEQLLSQNSSLKERLGPQDTKTDQNEQDSEPASVPPERCRAMMEVILDGDSWTTSKLVTDHNHELSPSLAAGSESPAIGMGFESTEAAKAFYFSYGDRAGFQPRIGSSRRSDDGSLIMQRFLCWRGDHHMYKKNTSSVTRKQKSGPYMGPYRKIAPKMQMVAPAAVENNAQPAEKGERTDVHMCKKSAHAVMRKPKGKSGPYVGPYRKIAPRMPMAAPAAVENNAQPAEKGERTYASHVVDTTKSHVLREPGVRVQQYTNEERRDIILKYMKKRSNRPAVEKPNKIPSQPTLGGGFQDGIAGSAHDDRTSNTHVMEGEANAHIGDTTNGGEPKVGMVFTNEYKAYEFYVKYAGNIGFSVRKGWWDKSANNVTTSRVFLCSKEGFRPTSITNEATKTRPETRTGCPARMAIKILTNGKYSVSEFVPDHNHQLAAPLHVQMLKSQRMLTKSQSGCRRSVNLIPAEYKNYLRSKRTKDMQMGDAGAVLEYLQKMKSDDPSFFYAIQLDEDDQLTNIFWVDAKSMMDYYYFGDVVCFDTTYKLAEYGRPFAQFIGVNHHKQIVFFGAALIYDESIESFKWLFETFKGAMSGKQPKTILTDQCAAKIGAIAAVWPGTVHRLCVWHIYQNAAKYLSHVFHNSESFSRDFATCIYDCEDGEEEFLSSWKAMLEKYDLDGNEWLTKLYKLREKWAPVYGQQTFCADMKSTLRRENFSSLLKEYLNPEIELQKFFEYYDKIVGEHRYAERQADYHAGQAISGIPPFRLLWQAANVYTPTIFESFRMEVELMMNCILYICGDSGTLAEYEVTVREKTKGYFVRFDSSDGTITCSCKKFESVGIQCFHVLKVLDHNNIKELPPGFILNRWRKDAKSVPIRENPGFALDGDPRSSVPKRYSSLCRMLYKIAAKAAENVEAHAFLESQSDQLLEQVERILQTKLRQKPTVNTVTKGRPESLLQGEGVNLESSESQGVSGKKKDGGVRRRQRSPLDMNKRQKGRPGQSGETEVAMNNDPPMVSNSILSPQRNPNQFLLSQFMQGHAVQRPYVPGHQFGLGQIQDFPRMNHFSQDSLVSALQQQPFHASGQLAQNDVQACTGAPDAPSLQFVPTPNPQLSHPNDEQGNYSIPVWDFL